MQVLAAQKVDLVSRVIGPEETRYQSGSRHVSRMTKARRLFGWKHFLEMRVGMRRAKYMPRRMFEWLKRPGALLGSRCDIAYTVLRYAHSSERSVSAYLEKIGKQTRRSRASMRSLRTVAFALVAAATISLAGSRCSAQAALLMEEPYGFFGTVNPTGHTAVYFQRICAETPTKLRRCEPGELGAVVSRYAGISGLDWVVIPLVPYLYSVESPEAVPASVDKDLVNRLRSRYHEEHLLSLGEHLQAGDLLHGGWTELIGVAYERRIYAFSFNTTEAQDDALIAKMNDKENRTHFQLLFNNCSDFARVILNEYFPGTFKRSIFPDAGMTTPKQITYKLVRYSKKHQDTDLRVFVIPQIPGYRRLSRSNKSISESLITTGYAIPIAVVNPYLAGGLFVDYMIRGRYHLMPKHPETLGPTKLAALTGAADREENPESAQNGIQAGSQVGAPRAAENGLAETPASSATFSLKEITSAHE